MAFFKKLDTGWTCADGAALLEFLLSLSVCRFKNLHRRFLVAKKRSLLRTQSFDPVAHDLPGTGLDTLELAMWKDEYRHFLTQLGAYEKLILRGLQKGLPLSEISGLLDIDVRTTKKHVERITRCWARRIAESEAAVPSKRD